MHSEMFGDPCPNPLVLSSGWITIDYDLYMHIQDHDIVYCNCRYRPIRIIVKIDQEWNLFSDNLTLPSHIQKNIYEHPICRNLSNIEFERTSSGVGRVGMIILCTTPTFMANFQ